MKLLADQAVIEFTVRQYSRACRRLFRESGRPSTDRKSFFSGQWQVIAAVHPKIAHCRSMFLRICLEQEKGAGTQDAG